MSLMASAFYGAFCRRWRGYGVAKAMGLGLTIGVIGQVVILLATVVSYALHVNTYFVNPRALAGEHHRARVADVGERLRKLVGRRPLAPGAGVDQQKGVGAHGRQVEPNGPWRVPRPVSIIPA